MSKESDPVQKLEDALTRTEALFSSYQYLDLKEIYEKFRIEKKDIMLALNSWKTCGSFKHPQWDNFDDIEAYTRNLITSVKHQVLDANEEYKQEQIGEKSVTLALEGLDWAYNILGLSTRATDDECRKAYRNKLQTNHPDKLANTEMDEAFTKLAEKRIRDIKEAWDMVKKKRNIR